jgi:hypothetical protein
VIFTSEVRTFVLDDLMLNASLYEETAEIADAIAFVSKLTKVLALLRAVIVDVGLIASRGWAVIEFNAAWGAGLNGLRSRKSSANDFGGLGLASLVRRSCQVECVNLTPFFSRLGAAD